MGLWWFPVSVSLIRNSQIQHLFWSQRFTCVQEMCKKWIIMLSEHKSHFKYISFFKAICQIDTPVIFVWLKQSTGLISYLFPLEKLHTHMRRQVRSEAFAHICSPVAVWVCEIGYILSIPSAEFNRFSLCSGNTTLVMALLILLHSNISPGNGWSVFNFSKTSLWEEKCTTNQWPLKLYK